MDDIQKVIDYLEIEVRTMKKYNIDLDYAELCENVISAMRELQQYRQIGTLEECQELSGHVRHWANEARAQAGTAGELQIALAYRLEAIRILEKVNDDLLKSPDNSTQKAILAKNAENYAEQEKWLERILNIKVGNE